MACVRYTSIPNRLQHIHNTRIGRSISSTRSASWWITPPRYSNCLVSLYLCPDYSMTNGPAGCPPVSVFATTCSPSSFPKLWNLLLRRRSHYLVIILASPSGALETTTLRQTWHICMPLRRLRDKTNTIGIKSLRPLQRRTGFSRCSSSSSICTRTTVHRSGYEHVEQLVRPAMIPASPVAILAWRQSISSARHGIWIIQFPQIMMRKAWACIQFSTGYLPKCRAIKKTGRLNLRYGMVLR